jgi:hypothetical protein
MTNSGVVDGIIDIDEGQSKPEALDGEVLLYCAGEAWMEDEEGDGGANRRKVGPFALMKLKAVKRENLIYTVDVSRPISIEDTDDNAE